MSETFLHILGLLIGITVSLASFVTGLRSTDPLWLWKRPHLLMRSLLAILVVVPLVEVFVVEVLSPGNVYVRAGLTVSILSVGMGPPNLLKRTQAPKEVVCYEIGLNLALTTLAVVYMPLAVAIHGAVFHHELSLSWLQVARVVLLKSILPCFAGVAVARWLPKVAAPLERCGPQFVSVAMLFVALLVLIAAWRRLIGLGVSAWLTCAVIAAMAICIGHVAGGPTRETRSVLAGFSAIRFPALALLLISVVPRGAVLIPVVLAYVISSGVMVAIYHAATGRHAAEKAQAKPL